MNQQFATSREASTRHPLGSIIRLIDDGSEVLFFGQR
jgi:hypothetical protein